MNRHTKTRIRNRFVHPILAVFEALWMGVQRAFKALFKPTENDLYRP
jgi:hypothetical protein